jgi:hypothetical protein
MKTDEQTSAVTHPTVSSIRVQLENYLMELWQHTEEEKALSFWKHILASYSQLVDLAEDSITEPMLNIFFSLCGDKQKAARII